MFLFARATSLGWRVTRNISFAEGEERVAQGTMRRVLDSQYNHIGYQPLDAGPDDRELPSLHSSAAISAAEMQANAGLHGRSRTRGLREDVRMERVSRTSGHPLPPEDFIERAIGKVELWMIIGDTKAENVALTYRQLIAAQQQTATETAS